MKGGDPVGEVAHQRGRQPAVLGHAVEQRRLVEAAHHQHPVDRRRRAEGQFARRGAAERADLEIELGCRAPVELKLGHAGQPAPLGGREIEVGVLYRALQLVRTVAGEKDDRRMGLDSLDPLHRRAIGGWSPEKIDDVTLIVGHY